jgi:uncharacterized membrane protein YhaH (DUF805 family)
MKQYADFSGRARRKEFWMFFLFNLIFGIVANVIDIALLSSEEGNGFGIFSILYLLGVLLPNLAVIVRRLHDIGKSGGWIFIALIPFIGSIWLLVLLAKEGDDGENEYGEDPEK